MDDLRKFLMVIAALILVVALGVGIGYFGLRNPKMGPSPAAPASAANTVRQASNPSRSDAIPSRVGAPSPTPTIPVATNPGTGATPPTASPPPPPLTQTNLITDWEDRLDEVLAGEQPEADKAKDLLALFPRLPQDGQVEVAQHLANLVEDEQYPMLGGFLTNTALPEEVLDVLLTDLLNRPNGMKVPLLVGVARDPKNPKAAEAKDILELYLEEDYGPDWNLWQRKAEEWVKENPD